MNRKQINNIVNDIRLKIKNEGLTMVVTSLSIKIEEIESKLNDITKKQIELERLLSNYREDLTLTSEYLVDQKIRSAAGKELVKLTTQDVYMLNKHIERLERKIEEMRPKPDNPYPHLFTR